MNETRVRRLLRRARRSEPPRFRSDDPDHTRWLAAQIWAGEYDRPGWVAQRGWTVVDIGANVGVFSVLSARRKAKVIAYEPHPDTFRHLSHNAGRRGVTCHQAAVVARVPPEGTVRLYLGDRDTRHSLFAVDQGEGGELHDHVTVPAISVREVLQGGCDLAKIDCEGAEFELFESLSEEDLSGVLRLVIELHGSPERMSAFEDDLQRKGFECIHQHSDNERLGLCFAQRTRP